ncbi:hypothetical protein [Nonomuraea longispora]|uniref:hypothetical protein n=1 Tax=Nonomuraea longispora TaxID=1848320 RepID=UPI0014055AF1|nr:hypothetical protein [Nonomuraea longispora]
MACIAPHGAGSGKTSRGKTRVPHPEGHIGLAASPVHQGLGMFGLRIVAMRRN